MPYLTNLPMAGQTRARAVPVNEDRPGSLGRKTFLSGAMLGIAAALTGCKRATENVATTPTNDFYKVLSRKEYDYDGMMTKLRIPNSHKQVFSTSAIIVQPGANHAALFAHMQFAMNGYDFSLGLRGPTLATLGVVAGSSVILGLNDAMWQKYQIGKRFNVAATNVYYRAKFNLDPNLSPNDPTSLYQDLSAQAVLKRAGSFMLCHNALASLAHSCAATTRTTSESVLAEMIHNLQPGFMLVPAGVTAVQLAQEHGWKVYTVA